MGDSTMRMDAGTAAATGTGCLAPDARFAMAVKLFEMKRVCPGQAAQLAGIDRTTFFMRLAENNVATIDLLAEELAQDARNAGPA
jgi:predicted HTH domain antitoxin